MVLSEKICQENSDGMSKNCQAFDGFVRKDMSRKQ